LPVASLHYIIGLSRTFHGWLPELGTDTGHTDRQGGLWQGESTLIQTVRYFSDLRCSFAHKCPQFVRASCKALNSIVRHQVAPRYAQNFQVWATNAVWQHKQPVQNWNKTFHTQVMIQASNMLHHLGRYKYKKLRLLKATNLTTN